MSKLRRTFLLVLIFALWNAVWAAPAAAQGHDGVVFGRLKTYTHEGGKFTVDYPSAWKIANKVTDDDGGFVVFIDKTGTAKFQVFALQIDAMSKELSSLDLTELITVLVEKQYGNLTRYAMQSPREISSSKSVLSFTFESDGIPMSGQALIEMWGDANVVTLILMHIPADQYSRNRKVMSELANSLEVMQTRPLQETGTLVLQEYEHPEGAFRIEYPQGWKSEDMSSDAEDTRITARFWQPKGLAYIRLDVISQGGKASVGQITEWIETNTDTIFGDRDEYEAAEVDKVDKDSVRRVFSYKTKDADGETVLMYGVMVVRRYEGMVSYLQILMPSTMVQLKQGVGLMRNIMDSLQIDVDVAGEILN